MIRRACKYDLETLADLAASLWGGDTARNFAEELEKVMEKDDAVFFLAYDRAQPVGFAQCQLRYDYVEGASVAPVGYLEGIFVKENRRGEGYAGNLLEECQNWARSRGCVEFASDCELNNECSLNFHQRTGFTETNRIICFIKKL